MFGNLKTLAGAGGPAERWQLDVAQALQHAEAAAALAPQLAGLWPAVFNRLTGAGAGGAPGADTDVDEDLYGGFVGDGDRQRLHGLRALSPEKLAQSVADNRTHFDDPRLDELLFRYRARNYPATLTPQESARWEAHRAARLFDGEGGARTLEGLFAEIDTLSETADERGEEILGALYDYAEAIAPDRD